MKEVYIDSLGLLRGARVGLYETAEELNNAAGDQLAALTLANKYLGEKGALVEFRHVFAEKLAEACTFPIKTNQVTKTYKDGTSEVVEVADETEVKFLNRFRGACTAGEVNGWPTDETGIENRLQAFADELGVFNVDAAKPVRQPGKSKQPGKTVLAAAENIFKNNRQDYWWQKMSDEGISIAARTGDEAQDKLALARAIKDREDRRNAAEYA